MGKQDPVMSVKLFSEELASTPIASIEVPDDDRRENVVLPEV